MCDTDSDTDTDIDIDTDTFFRVQRVCDSFSKAFSKSATFIWFWNRCIS